MCVFIFYYYRGTIHDKITIVEKCLYCLLDKRSFRPPLGSALIFLGLLEFLEAFGLTVVVLIGVIFGGLPLTDADLGGVTFTDRGLEGDTDVALVEVVLVRVGFESAFVPFAGNSFRICEALEIGGTLVAFGTFAAFEALVVLAVLAAGTFGGLGTLTTFEDFTGLELAVPEAFLELGLLGDAAIFSLISFFLFCLFW